MAESILITGVAGFIGHALAEHLTKRGDLVIGLDNLNDYYSINLKKARLKTLSQKQNFTFYKLDLCDKFQLEQLFKDNKITKICNLAAQAGVRYSLENPDAYQKSNLEGFLNILEMARNFKVENFVYASSSSVYGKSDNYPYLENQETNTPISLYAATKKANELMAHTYSHLFGLNTTGLRFFTVYGPYGRPDMSPMLFTEAILNNLPIKVFNHGNMFRDFTYIDDIIAGVTSCLDKHFRYEIFNLGNNKPVKLTDYIAYIEKNLGIRAIKEFLPMQAGDVFKTYANIDHAKELLGYEPKTELAVGIKHFINWYRDFYGK